MTLDDLVRLIRLFPRGLREPLLRELPEAPPYQRVIGGCACTPDTCLCWEREQELRKDRGY